MRSVSGESRSSIRGRLFSWLGPVIGLAGMIFVARQLLVNWDDVSRALAGSNLVTMAAATLTGLIALGILGAVWKLCLGAVGHGIGLVPALHQYFVGQLGKYVPGGIWPVVGRAEMARRSGAAGPTAYWATVLAMVLTYLAAILWSLIALLAGASGSGGVHWQPVIALLPVGILILHPKVLALVFRVFAQITGRNVDALIPRWSSSIVVLLAYLPAWLGITTATWLVGIALGAEADFLNILFATTISWTVGFLIIPAPGGIGVREAAFVAAATSLGSGGMAAAVAVTARFLFILSDAIGAGLTTLLASAPIGGRIED